VTYGSVTTHELPSGESVVAKYEQESQYIDSAYEKVTALQVGARDPNVRVRKFSYVQVCFKTHPGIGDTQQHPAMMRQLMPCAAPPNLSPDSLESDEKENLRLTTWMVFAPLCAFAPAQAGPARSENGQQNKGISDLVMPTEYDDEGRGGNRSLILCRPLRLDNKQAIC
jgi:hypothetical protein